VLSAPVKGARAILRCGLSYKERNWNVPEYADDKYPRSFDD
jgi:hypothetical protein